MGKKRVIEKSAQVPEVKSAESKAAGIKVVRKVQRGIAHIRATYNNTLITITDEKGNTLAWATSGGAGFSGTKKSTPFAAARVAEQVAERARKFGIEHLEVRVSGVGSGRDSAIRALANRGFNVVSIKDVTPLPHNGPRPRKPRRV